MGYYIHTVIVFVIGNTIRKAVVTVMIGNYIHRVIVIEGSLFSRVRYLILSRHFVRMLFILWYIAISQGIVFIYA